MIKKIMITKLTIIIGIFILSNNVIAGDGGDPAIENTFNYQGELINNGTPANGLHDFIIEAYTTDVGDDTLGELFELIKVNVTDGIFTINEVDLGDITDGFDVYLQISVRENGVDADYEALSPRHKITSVPYATTLISGNAQQDQVLTFDNGEWSPMDLPEVQNNSRWVITEGSNINYTAGYVSIGGNQSPTSTLHVKSVDGLSAQFDGGANSMISILEQGEPRGYIGSTSSDADEDFTVGTVTGDLHLISGLFSEPSVSLTLSGNVGIGIEDPTSTFHVNSDNALIAQFNGAEGAQVNVLEQGVPKGYIGSVGTVADDDFAVGSVTGDLHFISGLFNEPSLSITNSGDVGINTINPLADLFVEGTTDGDLLRVRIDGATKLLVQDNGGTAIGGNFDTPDDGLFVAGNVKQTVNSNGVMKYMVAIVNCGSANVSILRSYNGINDTPITVQNDAGGIGSCEVNFAQDLSNRYISVSETSGLSATGNSASCSHGANTISCVVFDAAGNETPGQIDLLIY